MEENSEEQAVSWEATPDTASTLVIHHESILRNKRLLLAYANVRMRRIVELRWKQGRVLRPDQNLQLCQAERDFFRAYDKLLLGYMNDSPGGTYLDLTLDSQPPKDPLVEVHVLRDHGEVMFSHPGAVRLMKGTVHLLPREEAEPLILEGILEQMDT